MSSSQDDEPPEEVFTFDPVISPNTVNVGGQQRLPVEVDGKRHTVQARDIERFENQIIRELKDPKGEGRSLRESPSGNVRRGSAIPIKGRWIHDWLESMGEDYINNIFRNWLFFVKALKLKTERDRERAEDSTSVPVFNRSPGTYDSMYNYLMLLVEQDVITKQGTELVPQSEYDKPVPEEFRRRTFLSVSGSYGDNKRVWENPYRANYPEAYPDLKEPVEEEEEPLDEVEKPLPEEPDEEGLEPVPSGIDAPSGKVSIEDFPEKGALLDFIENNAVDILEQAVELTDEETPDVPGSRLNPEEFEVGRTIVIGPWAVGEASAGQTPLHLFMSVRVEGGGRAPFAIIGNFSSMLSTVLNEQNPYPLWFPSYDVKGAFGSTFSSQLQDEIMRRDFDVSSAYNLNAQQRVSTGLEE